MTLAAGGDAGRLGRLRQEERRRGEKKKKASSKACTQCRLTARTMAALQLEAVSAGRRSFIFTTVTRTHRGDTTPKLPARKKQRGAGRYDEW